MNRMQTGENELPHEVAGSHWSRWPGVPVYGLDSGTEPPDLSRPWLPPAAPPQTESAPGPPGQSRQAPPNQAVPTPTIQWQAPAQPPMNPFAPTVLGPAETPEERAARLGLPLPPPPNG